MKEWKIWENRLNFLIFFQEFFQGLLDASRGLPFALANEPYFVQGYGRPISREKLPKTIESIATDVKAHQSHLKKKKRERLSCH